ncbi:MAG: DNA methylase [Erysipelotrichaceae bacterium]|nr:DNA methylase [Erysipelotrichaceae bacterium]
MERQYVAIDLKSFYASVECVERGMDPLATHLVVADGSRTEKTICLAVSPSLKAYGISGRARLFEVVQRVKEINRERAGKIYPRKFTGKSVYPAELELHPEYELDYVIAPPRMAFYIDYSTKIYDVYLKYVAPEDMHVYSIDEVFIDVTSYLKTYQCTARELAMRMMKDVLHHTGVTATCGIGTNMYLAKVAMDVVAKHMPADENGVRIAELNEISYREQLWTHRPLTDFWRIGKGIARRLENLHLFTLGDVCRCSLENEDLLYKTFGINAELLIDHAWGYEPCTIADIKSYKPVSNSVGMGQVLTKPYTYEKARLIVKEMIENLSLDLVDKKLVSDQLVLMIGYDIENLIRPEIRQWYMGDVVIDHYGREVPKPAQGTIHLPMPTSSTELMKEHILKLFERISDPNLLVRRVNITAAHTVPEDSITETEENEQLNLFVDYKTADAKKKQQKEEREKEKRAQQAILSIKKKYGKNSILKGMNLEEDATAKERNRQIGGHKE